MAGIAGLMRREKQQLEQTDKSLNEAFSDLNALMTRAQEMVKLAENIRSRLAVSGPVEDQADDTQDMQDWLLSMGIVSPVTKKSAGTSYHKELAKELSSTLIGPTQKAGGMLSLVDAYCLINRARGIELISPNDMLKACEIWDTSDVPMKLRKFESGVVVIQHNMLSEAKILGTIKKLVELRDGRFPGINANDLSKELGISPSLAKEQLLIAESQGILCRDDSSEGLIFYHNFFL